MAIADLIGKVFSSQFLAGAIQVTPLVGLASDRSSEIRQKGNALELPLLGTLVTVADYPASADIVYSGPIFNNYVSTIYNLRLGYKKAKDRARDLLAKYLLNGLYGKYGQRDYGRWEDITDTEEGFIMKLENEATSIERYEDIWEDEVRQYLQVKNRLYSGASRMDSPSKRSVMSIPSFITSSARTIVNKAMHTVLHLGGNVYYCDTDSIFTSIPLPSDMVSDTELGKWKLEGEYEAGELTFIAPKHYRQIDTWKIKGIRNPSSDHSFRQAQFPSFITDLTSKN